MQNRLTGQFSQLLRRGYFAGRYYVEQYAAAVLLTGISVVGITWGLLGSLPVSGASYFSTILPIASGNPVMAAEPVMLTEDEPGGILPQTIGRATGGLPIRAYSFGNGPVRVAFIGGIHGGYEWNTVLLAYEAIDYFVQHPEAVPRNVTLQIVPVANPDGFQRVTGALGRFKAEQVAAKTEDGRFNQNHVDLNRNWDCNWEAEAWWGVRQISGGRAPFSEVESQLLRDFLMQETPVAAAVFWHSAGFGVFPGYCNSRFAPADALAATYATAAGYPMQAEFTAYRVTGDATDWLAAQGVPAIVVELTQHDRIEWEQNLAGLLSTLDYLAQQP